MRKPAAVGADWAELDAEPVRGQTLTPAIDFGGKLQRKLDGIRDAERDRRARYLRDFGGRDRDARRVPTPEYVDSGRTPKSSSKVRVPSEAFRKGYIGIRWDR